MEELAFFCAATVQILQNLYVITKSKQWPFEGIIMTADIYTAFTLRQALH